jgi:hypothetical protein
VNERIQELAKQADNYAYKMNPEQDSYGRSANPRKFQQDRDAKFAELIVRECVKSTIALQNTAIDNEWHLDETFHIIVDDMVEQFDMQHIFRS